MNKKLNKELKEMNKSLNELKNKSTKWSKRPLTNGGLLKLYGIASVISIAICAIPLVIYKIKRICTDRWYEKNSIRKEEPETATTD